MVKNAVKTNLNRRTSKKRNYKRRTPSKMVSTIKKIVKSTIMKKAESKHKDLGYGDAFNITQLNHNSLNTFMLNSGSVMPTQGTADNQRVGDQINVGGFYVRALCAHKADRPNLTWKFYVFRLPKGTSLSYANLFEATTNDVLLDNPNTDKVKVLFSKTIKPAMHPQGQYLFATNTYKEFSFPVKFLIKYRRQYKFPTAGGTEHNDHDIVLVVFAYDTLGTLVSDTVASIQLVNTMYYKDP